MTRYTQVSSVRVYFSVFFSKCVKEISFIMHRLHYRYVLIHEKLLLYCLHLRSYSEYLAGGRQSFLELKDWKDWQRRGQTCRALKRCILPKDNLIITTCCFICLHCLYIANIFSTTMSFQLLLFKKIKAELMKKPVILLSCGVECVKY